MVKYFLNNFFLSCYLILFFFIFYKNFFFFNILYNYIFFLIIILLALFFFIKKKIYKKFYILTIFFFKKNIDFLGFIFLFFLIFFYQKNFNEINALVYLKIIIQFFFIYNIINLFFIRKINFLPLLCILNIFLITNFLLIFYKSGLINYKKDLTNSLSYIIFFSFFLNARYLLIFYKKINFLFILNFFLCVLNFIYLIYYANTYIFLFTIFTTFIFILTLFFKKNKKIFISISLIKKLLYLFFLFIFFSFFIYVSDYFIFLIHKFYLFFLKCCNFIFGYKEKIVCDELISVVSRFGNIQNKLHTEFPVLCFVFYGEPPGYSFWIGFIERVVQYKIYLSSFIYPINFVVGNFYKVVVYNENIVYTHNSFLNIFSTFGLIIYLFLFNFFINFLKKLKITSFIDILPICLFFLGSTFDDYLILNRYECTLFVWLMLLFNYHLKFQKKF